MNMVNTANLTKLQCESHKGANYKNEELVIMFVMLPSSAST